MNLANLIFSSLYNTFRREDCGQGPEEPQTLNQSGVPGGASLPQDHHEIDASGGPRQETRQIGKN